MFGARGMTARGCRGRATQGAILGSPSGRTGDTSGRIPRISESGARAPTGGDRFKTRAEFDRRP